MSKRTAYHDSRTKGWATLLLPLYVFLLTALLPVAAKAQSPSVDFIRVDTLNIRFRLDSIRIDMGFAGNEAAWKRFEDNFFKNYSNKNPRALRIDIYSGASPEGTATHNRWLGENRGIAVRRLVRSSFGDHVGNIIVHNEAARWEDFRDAIAASDEPWRDEVLRIIEQPTSKNPDLRDPRETELRALHGGTVWPILLDRYLSPLRGGATAILSFDGGRDTVIVRETRVQLQPVPAVGPGEGGAAVAQKEPKPEKHYVKRPAWILRSNLPLLGTGTPNLQAEWSLGHKDRWSLNIEGIMSWWTFSRNAYANELILGTAELRYWLGNRQRHHTLSGWHIGLGVGGGYGDLEWKSKGYQFEAISAYLNFGWQARFGKRRQWAFDAGIGLGYLYAPYRYYRGSTLFPVGREEQYDDHLMWQETKRLNWFGSPHLNISIGYVFQPRNGAFRRAQAVERDRILNSHKQVIERQRESEALDRERQYALWLQMPKAERKAAQKAFEDSLKTARRNAREEAKAQRRANRQLLKQNDGFKAGVTQLADSAQQQSVAERAAEKQRRAAEKEAEKQRRAAERLAAIEAKATADAKRDVAKETAKRKAAEQKAAEKAAREAEKQRLAAEKQAAKAAKQAEKEAAKAAREAQKEAAKAAKQAEKERRAAEKAAEKERRAAEKRK